MMADTDDLAHLVEGLQKDPPFRGMPTGFLVETIRKDPSWPERFREIHRQNAAKHRAGLEARAAAMRPLLDELDAAGLLTYATGIPGGTIRAECLNEAFPYLIKWFPQMTLRDARENIAFHLEDPLAVNWMPELIALFRSQRDMSPDPPVWRLGSAIGRYGTAAFVDDYLDLVQDTRFGIDRMEIAYALWKYRKDPRVVPVLVRLVTSDPNLGVVRGALYSLRRIADPSTREVMAAFLDHPEADIRKTANEGIAKIDKKLARG